MYSNSISVSKTRPPHRKIRAATSKQNPEACSLKEEEGQINDRVGNPVKIKREQNQNVKIGNLDKAHDKRKCREVARNHNHSH